MELHPVGASGGVWRFRDEMLRPLMIELIEKELNLGEKEEEKENAACVYAQLRSDLLNGDFPLALRLILYC